MSIPRSAFIDANERDLHVGDRVRFVSSAYGEDEGVVEYIWYGCEEMVDVRRATGELVTLGIDLDDVRRA